MRPTFTFTLVSLLLQQVITQNSGHYYEHPESNEGDFLTFVNAEGAWSPQDQHIRLRRQALEDANNADGQQSIVHNTLSTDISTTGPANVGGQSKPIPPTPPPVTSATGGGGGTRVNTRVSQTGDQGQHFWEDDEDLRNRTMVTDEDAEEGIKSKVKDPKYDTDNVTDTSVMDSHKYYVGHFVEDSNLWVDLDKLKQQNDSMVKEHKMLSKSYRRAATVPLSFPFPFYGHNVTNITIATGGFLYTGDYVHAWLAATQYIAPLMANFDTSQNDQAKIRYADNGTALIVEWEKVHLKARDSQLVKKEESAGPSQVSPFSFQVILHSSGDIVFAYKVVPVVIQKIGDKEHPVKVGLSDAYIIDRTIFFVRRKTIYEYHRMDMKDHQIRSDTAIYFKALATCISKHDCQSCIDTQVEAEPENQTADTDVWEHGKSLGCMWCPDIRMCSDGMDRLRQTWLRAQCENRHHKKGERECADVIAPLPPHPSPNPRQGSGRVVIGGHDGHEGGMHGVSDNDFRHHTHGHDYSTLDSNHPGVHAKVKSTGGHYQAGLVTTVSLSLLLVLSCFVWFGYAYFFPHTWSGQLLIKYRPSHWQWRRAEPRYTAASIHM